MAIATINIGAPMPTSVELAGTDLSADNAVNYNLLANQLLIITNASGGDYTPTLIGDAASGTYFAKGIGYVPLNSGKPLPLMADGEEFIFKLKSADNFLQGAVTITPATAGVTALVLEI